MEPMDFGDYFTQDLERNRKAPPSPWEKPQIPPATRERIDRLSSDDHGLDRPTRRGPAPTEEEIEPPIMPSEHWLEDEHRYVTPAGEPSKGKIFVSRSKPLRPIQRGLTYQASYQEDEVVPSIELDDYFFLPGWPFGLIRGDSDGLEGFSEYYLSWLPRLFALCCKLPS